MRAGRPRCPSHPMHAMALHHTTTMGVCHAQGGGGCSLLSGVSCVLHLHVCLVISWEGELQYVLLFGLSHSYTLVCSTPSCHSLQLTPWATLVEMSTEVSLENTKWVHMTACFVSACHPKVCSRRARRPIFLGLHCIPGECRREASAPNIWDGPLL